MIKSKRTLLPILNRVEDKMKLYMKNCETAQEQYSQTFQEFLSNYNINTFFYNIHEHLTTQRIKHYKKNTILQDGIYLLVKGHMVYVWSKNKHDRDRKQHLFNLAKSGTYSILMENPLLIDPLLDISYSFSVQESLAVLECEQKNYMTVQDCLLIKLSQKTLQQTNFYKLKNQRVDLCQNAYLSGSNNTQPHFALNTSLHHTFKQKKEYFHNKLILQSMGIILKGSVKIANGNNLIAAQKYAILIPSTQYQVITSQLVVLIVNKNPTLTFLTSQLIEKYKSVLKIRQKVSVTDHKKKKTFQGSFYDSEKVKNLKASELKKRKKQINGFSRQYENYCILPTYSCQQNLQYVQKVNSFQKKNEEKCKSPLVLFNLTNTRYNKSYPSFSNYKSQEDGSDIKKKRDANFRQTMMKNNDLMQRYQAYSRSLYKKYIAKKNQKNQSYHNDKNEKNTKYLKKVSKNYAFN